MPPGQVSTYRKPGFRTGGGRYEHLSGAASVNWRRASGGRLPERAFRLHGPREKKGNGEWSFPAPLLQILPLPCDGRSALTVKCDPVFRSRRKRDGNM
ncbi:hypothetical protein GCM10018785_31390 [Streptomyces longispororuber]|uniref:Uncharacterized protein n=1 Tax=Streptomyces longispororuber TaxID=68230 RepID=A0A918ZMC4_9ACTN|nr:hypothetical protein GCM10018785_31390 [Streptomyces longispororuber]